MVAEFGEEVEMGAGIEQMKGVDWGYEEGEEVSVPCV